MAGRSFTKQEKRLFYMNAVVAIIGFLFSAIWSYGSYQSIIITSTTRSGIGQMTMWTSFVGMFAILLAAQFANCWKVVYLIIQILVVLNVLCLVAVSGFMSFLLPKMASDFEGSLDPDSLESLKEAASSIVDFLYRNIDFRDIYKTAEESIGFCGLYSIDDSLGRSCTYSSSDACNGDYEAFIPVVIRFMGEVMTSLARMSVVYLIIEIIIFIFIIPTLKSSPETQEKRVQMMPLPSDGSSQRAPLMANNPPTQANPVFVPVQQNPPPAYNVKPVSEGVFPAIPVAGHMGAQ